MLEIKSSNVTVMVGEMDRAIEFYTNGLGLSLVRRWGNHYAQVAAPGVIIGLHPTDRVSPGAANVSIGFGVSDIESAKKRLAELNIGYKSSDGKAGNIVSFSDPDGTPLYFILAV
jgi:catechol 2,3-dioxygenase-like lactoylglutathione lyase family enzyme